MELLSQGNNCCVKEYSQLGKFNRLGHSSRNEFIKKGQNKKHLIRKDERKMRRNECWRSRMRQRNFKARADHKKIGAVTIRHKYIFKISIKKWIKNQYLELAKLNLNLNLRTSNFTSLARIIENLRNLYLPLRHNLAGSYWFWGPGFCYIKRRFCGFLYQFDFYIWKVDY